MQHVYIPSERVKLIRKDKKLHESLERLCNCKITITSNDAIEVSSESSYDEFVAKNIIFAFGRGFDIAEAAILKNDDCYFTQIDLDQMVSNVKRKMQIKARIIGEGGKTKTYIEGVSGAKLSIHGDTVSFIGTASQINEAETAVNILVQGGTHKLAYSKMEAAHRKNKTQRQDATF